MTDKQPSRRLALRLSLAACVAVAAVSTFIAFGVIPRLASAASADFMRVEPGLYTKRVSPELLANLHQKYAQARTPSDLLQKIVSALSSSLIVKSAIGVAPSGFTPTEDPTIPVPESFTNGLWAYLRVTAPDDGPGSIKSIWLADLVVGALRDELLADSMPLLYNAVVTVQLPDGRAEDIGGGVGNVTYGQVFSSASNDEIEADITASSKAAGFEVVRLEVFRALQPAVALVVRAADAPAMIRNPLEAMRQAFGKDPASFEGVYFEARDADDHPVLIEAGSFRTGVGHEWIRPGLAPPHIMAGPSGGKSG